MNRDTQASRVITGSISRTSQTRNSAKRHATFSALGYYGLVGVDVGMIAHIYKVDGARLVVFSRYLRFLAILQIALKRWHKLEGFEYTGHVPKDQRPDLEAVFRS
jgi:hypothetical protein